MSSFEQAAETAISEAVALLSSDTPVIECYKTSRDFATNIDFRIEDHLRRFLARVTPDVGFLGEERGHTGSHDSYWCLDPIDGTSNFARGLPNYGISLALIQNGAPRLGEIALPAHNQRFSVRDGSAICNDRPISASGTSMLSESLIAVGDFATGCDGIPKNRARIRQLEKLANRVGRVRMLGSAATDLAWLAAGTLDAVLISSNRAWDVSAGIAIAEAAGAVVSHQDGSAYTMLGPDLLAAAPKIHRQVVDLIATAAGEAE